MEDLTAADFAAGDTFDLPAGDARVTLRLDRIVELPPAAREAGAFRLELSGPTLPLLPQGTYPFQVGGAEHEIFIVPIAQNTTGSYYEAIFN